MKDPYALDLIDKLLVLDPTQRTDSDDALNHDFFWTDPMPSDLKNMLSTHNQSMFEYLAPPRRRGSHMPQQSTNQNKNPAAANQTEFDRVFWKCLKFRDCRVARGRLFIYLDSAIFEVLWLINVELLHINCAYY